MLIVDFETRSRCDLKTKGVYNYAAHWSTTILCGAFTLLDPEDTWEYLWTPAQGPLPSPVIDAINNNEYIAAHNAAFDRLIWECVAVDDFGFPPLEFDRWYCTAAQCRVNNLPASLDDAARALQSTTRKDFRGAQLIKLLSLPQADGEFNNDPLLLAEMGAYCLQDVRTTKAVANATRLMTELEHEDWLNNEDINERGVLIDVDLAEAAERYANDEYIEISHELSATTNGVITKHTHGRRALKWIVERLGTTHHINQYLRKYVNGDWKMTLDKQAREKILHDVDRKLLSVPEDVLTVIKALHAGSASSVTKFKNMRARADDETDRVHGAFIYAGASQTLRYASRGLQLHNFPSRGLFKSEAEVLDTRKAMLTGAPIALPVMQTLKKMLRPAIIAPPAKKLIIGDWSGIEARVLPWLSDSTGGTAKLAKIADGVDVYIEAARAIGSPLRDVGKVMELSLGFGGGLAAFSVFAKSYGVVMTDDEIAPAIAEWRRLNAWVVRYWAQLESAAKKAMKRAGDEIFAGRVRFFFAEGLMGGSLLCILPDGSVLTYPQARLEEDQAGNYGITALKASVPMAGDATEWPRERMYGGKFAANVTQGTAAALLRGLIAQLDHCIAHVHDEVILEVEKALAVKYCSQLRRFMRTTPTWATGLPLAAEPIIVDRYQK